MNLPLAAVERLPIPAWIILLVAGAAVLAVVAAVATAIIAGRMRDK
ncbi:MAG TPA: hypothetical protein VMP01_21750 [Pirellulaceae bacterium]|nr:hypothetical protein [Pirellulaceae bacterium]